MHAGEATVYSVVEGGRISALDVKGGEDVFTADLEAEGDVIATQYLGADNCVCAAFSKGDLIVRMLDTEEVHIITCVRRAIYTQNYI